MSTLSRADTGAAATARTDLDRGRDRTAQPRGAGIAAIVIGLGLTAAPFAFQMSPGRRRARRCCTISVHS